MTLRVGDPALRTIAIKQPTATLRTQSRQDRQPSPVQSASIRQKRRRNERSHTAAAAASRAPAKSAH